MLPVVSLAHNRFRTAIKVRSAAQLLLLNQTRRPSRIRRGSCASRRPVESFAEPGSWMFSPFAKTIRWMNDLR